MNKKSGSLSVSLVVYYPDLNLLYETIDSLKQAYTHANERGCIDRLTLFIIENGADIKDRQSINQFLNKTFSESGVDFEYVSGHGNVGYGRGNNIGIQKSQSEYHLILNPDVYLYNDALENGLSVFQAHPEIGMLAPVIINDLSEITHLCKNYPDVLTLFSRGVGIAKSKTLKDRIDKYSLKKLKLNQLIKNIPIFSGCFMLYRTDVLKQLKGFDPSFFLYFEDFDLSLKTNELTQTALIPSMRIRHLGGGAAKKGGKHIFYFAVSAYKFFNKHGWKWL